jgi:hypothetical protein
MWTMWNFRVRYAKRINFFTLTGILVFTCSGCRESRRAPTPTVAPDAPLAALPAPEARPPSLDRSQLTKPVELKSVAVYRLDRETPLARLASRQFLKTAQDPLVIDVRVLEPLDPLPRTSWPVIVLNGRHLKNTRVGVDANDRLIAFLPDRRQVKRVNTVAVVWIGNEELTLTKRPLTFKATDIKD